MRTYYVDLECGTGDGSSPQTPRGSYRDLTLCPGDRVLFRRGSRVYDQLDTQSGTAENPVVYGAYGEGAKPIFCGSVDLSRPEDWKEVSENIWECVREVPAEACNLLFDGGACCGTLRWSREELSAQGDWTDSRIGSHECHGTEPVPAQQLLLYSTECPAVRYQSIECATREFRCLGKLRSNVTVQDLCFCNNGVHGLAGAGENITVRRCDFLRLGGCVWNKELKIQFGNAVEFWNISKNVSVTENFFCDIYDSGVTHQGGRTCEVTVNAHFDRNVFVKCGMGAYEGRDLVPVNLTFCENVCLDAGEGFSKNGATMPRRSEIWPQPMGHHVFLWRMEHATEGGHAEISGNFFGSAPYGGAIYSVMAPSAEAQFSVDRNVYAMERKTLTNRWGGCDCSNLEDFRRQTDMERNGRVCDGKLPADCTDSYEKAMQLLKACL